MENEENRGLINKKAYEDQWEGLVSSVLNFSLFSLSLSRTLEHLVYSWSTLVECGILGDLDQESKGKEGK